MRQRLVLHQLRENQQQPGFDLLAIRTGGESKIWTECRLNTEQSV